MLIQGHRTIDRRCLMTRKQWLSLSAGTRDRSTAKDSRPPLRGNRSTGLGPAQTAESKGIGWSWHSRLQTQGAPVRVVTRLFHLVHQPTIMPACIHRDPRTWWESRQKLVDLRARRRRRGAAVSNAIRRFTVAGALRYWRVWTRRRERATRLLSGTGPTRVRAAARNTSRGARADLARARQSRPLTA